ncbi:MAG: hypothetical protein HY552_00740 [Elusimicrobia bacterium]|nr:hypothetical protein [Elusimicrobiota bacterium]
MTNDAQRPSRARYGKIKTALDLKWRRRRPQPERMTRELVDALWETFGDQPWTWCGFWTPADGGIFQPGPARPAPAAVPAPPGGLLGEALARGQPRLGPGVIAVPALDRDGRVWAVFEARSAAAFDEMDARWLERLLKSFQVLEPSATPPGPSPADKT